MRATQFLPRTTRARLWALSSVALVGAAVGACSASLDFIECRQPSDCERFIGSGQLRCDNGACVPADCEKHSECGELGESFVCGLQGVCVDAERDGCALAVIPGGELGDDPVLMVGAIVDQGTPAGDAAAAAISLAVSDFNAGASLADGSQVALVICDNDGESVASRDAAEHLATKVGVPAIVGPLEEDAFAAVGEQVSVVPGNSIFTISPTAIAPLDFQDPNLLWRASPSAAFHAAAFKARIAELKPDSAVMLWRSDRYGISIYEGLTDEVGEQRVVNGIPQQANISFTDSAQAKEHFDALVKLLAKPDLIILVGGDEMGEVVKHIGASDLAGTKILISDRALPGLGAALTEAQDAKLTAGIEVIAPQRSSGNEGILAQRLSERSPGTLFNEEAILSYDAAMATLLAMRAVPQAQRVLGPPIAASVSRLISGEKVSFSDVDTFVAAAAAGLGGGASIDVVGFSGELAFNGGTKWREPCVDFIGWEFSEVEGLVAVPKRTLTFMCPEPVPVGTWSEP
ncbi:MAG: ABC transporter substrate-binding protein [Nannocystis sp.]|nr:ABC transporter substrate-binding protein [Nannocystis sp.]